MSKANLLINKKANPATPITTRSSHNIPNIKTLTYREPNSQTDDRTKLYTFCSSGNKPVEQENRPNEENHPIQQNDKDRKISLNINKSRILDPNTRSKSRVTGSQLPAAKDKNKIINKHAVLNQSNVIDRRKTDKLNLSKINDKKINISICINRNGLKGNQQIIDLNQTEDVNNDFKDKVNDYKQPIISKQQTIGVTKEGWNILNQSGKRKVMIDEEELQKFTHKFASEKDKLQDIINKLKEDICIYKQRQRELLQIKKDSEDYINFLQKQKKDLINATIKLKQSIKQHESDKQFYMMAKQEYRKTIKQDQEHIAVLQREINNLHQQIRIKQEKNKQTTNATNNHSLEQIFVNQLKIMEIENNFLRRQIQLSEGYRKINQFRSNNKDPNIQQNNKINILIDKNNYLSNEIKTMSMLQMQNDVNKKLVDHCAISISKLQQQNQKLRKQIFDNSISIKQSLQLSQFKFKLDSSRHKDDCSPSEVQIIWKRESSDFGQSRSRVSMAVGGYFDHDFFTERHNG